MGNGTTKNNNAARNFAKETMINSTKLVIASEARQSLNSKSVAWRLLRRCVPRNDELIRASLTIKRYVVLCLLALLVHPASAVGETDQTAAPSWTPAELATLRSLWIGSLPPLPPDPSNTVADDPRAAALGQEIFFDTRFSANGEVACASCHQPQRYFTDGLGQAEGVGKTQRSAPTIVGSAYSPWYFWDGRRDSQWSQALGPLENALEHGGSRTQYAHVVRDDPEYRSRYETVFGPLPDLSDGERFPDMAGPSADQQIYDRWRAMTERDREIITLIFVNIGKAIAAYERRLVPGGGRFDAYVQALTEGDDAVSTEAALSQDEIAGLRLFVGKAMCIRCHNGPMFTDHGFHNIGVPYAEGLNRDWGRYQGVRKVLKDEFNCLGEYSDAGQEDCAELRFAKTARDETIGAFKTPTLRNVTETAPYMHSGQLASLEEVLEHYRRPPRAPIGHTDLVPIELTAEEIEQLKAFLHTLSGPPAVAAELLSAASQ
jgi:cytochrome c peroxidase